LDLVYIPLLIATILSAFWFIYFFYKPSRKKSLNALYMEALDAMLLSDKRRAIKLLSILVKNDSEHVNAYLQLGNLLREEDTDRAIKIHQMLTVRQGLSNDLKIEILKSLAMDYEKINDLLKAKAESEKILKIDKLNIWANMFLLSIAEKTEDWDYAENKANDLMKIKSFNKSKINLSKYALQKGIEHFKNDDFDKAEKIFRKTINDSAEFGLPYKFLGEIYHSKRDLVKAVEYWEIFMELSPNDAHQVFDKIESALFDLGRYSEVEKFYRKVLEKNSDDINAAQRLANVLNEKGENKAALALIDQFLDNNDSSSSMMLMKLKLSLLAKTPSELGHYIDKILNKINNEKI